MRPAPAPTPLKARQFSRVRDSATEVEPSRPETHGRPIPQRMPSPAARDLQRFERTMREESPTLDWRHWNDGLALAVPLRLRASIGGPLQR